MRRYSLSHLLIPLVLASAAVVGCATAPTKKAWTSEQLKGQPPPGCDPDSAQDATTTYPRCRCYLAFLAEERNPLGGTDFPADPVCIDVMATDDAGNERPGKPSDVDSPQLITGPPSVQRHPNTNLVAIVLLGKDEQKKVIPQVSLGGTKGTYVPETVSGSLKSLGQTSQGLVGQPGPDIAFADRWIPTHRVYVFGPRTPGDSTLSVSFILKDVAKEPAKEDDGEAVAAEPPAPAAAAPAPDPGTVNNYVALNMFVTAQAGDKLGSGGKSTDDQSKTPTQFTYEYFVPQEYSGALRLGLSGVLSPFDHTYAIRKAPDATIGTVVDNGVAPVDAELVLGFAWFAASPGYDGRIYVGQASRTHWGLYTGLGLVSGSTSGVTWMRSLYLGAEYEFAPNSSIAFAAMVRRVNCLANGLSVGDPVADNTTLTKTSYAPALGIVLNFTPDFLKFATGLGGPK